MTADERRRKQVAVRGLTEITRHAAEAVGMTEIGRLILAYAEVIRDSNLDDEQIIAKYWQRDERYRRTIVCGYGYAYDVYAMREAYAMVAAERGIELDKR